MKESSRTQSLHLHLEREDQLILSRAEGGR